MSPVLLILALAAMWASPAQAQSVAPPPHWQAIFDDDEELDDDGESRKAAAAPKLLKGVAGKGIFSEVGSPCEGADGEVAGSQFWFYSTNSQILVFTRTPMPEAGAPCSTPRQFATRIFRGYVADGVVHGFEGEGDDVTPVASALQSMAIELFTVEALPYLLLSRGPAAPASGRGANTSIERRKVAGAPARCLQSGFHFFASEQCVLAGSSAYAGMVLSEWSRDDVSVFSSFEVETLHLAVKIDPRFFDLHTEWEEQKRK